MYRTGSVSVLLVAAIFSGLLASDAAWTADPPAAGKLGQKIDNFVLTDPAGKAFNLYDLKDKKAVVVVFLSFDCPVSTNYSPTLIALAKEYGERGVAFLGVCPGDEDPAQLARQAKEFQLPFPVLRDNRFVAVDALAAETTPEAFLLDGQFILRYRGRIDDSYYARLKKNAQTTKQDLKQSLDELLAGKSISQPLTKAVGCPIARPSAPKQPAGAVTYYRDVMPILQKNCQGCHRPGEVGPFALTTYKQAVNWSADIKEYSQSRKMPPWKPVAGPKFRDNRQMSDVEIATLAAWVDAGCPAGAAQDAPPPRTFTQGWQLGKPDLVLTPSAAYVLGPSGRDIFRCFVLPTNLPEDKYVTAIEVRPGNPRIVHHTLNFIDANGRGRKLEQAEKGKNTGSEFDFGPGYSMAMGIGFIPSGALGGWAPGQMARHLPAGAGYYLPKGSDVVLQVHYHRNGKLEKDHTQLGLYFGDQSVTQRFRGFVLPGRFLFIPPGADNFKVNGTITMEQDCLLHSIMPHMHLLGKSIQVSMTPPEGAPQTLIHIKDWDYNWQETYFFKEPIHVKAGAKFSVEAVFDNSAGNPNNPNNPPKLVRFGEQTTDEMCFVFFGATGEGQGRLKVRFGN